MDQHVKNWSVATAHADLRSRRRWLTAGFFGSALPLLLAAQRSIAQGAGTVRIGLSGPFTGGSAPMGISMRNGVRLAASELNFMRGVLGKRIELVERDDQANPDLGEKIATELIEKEKVVATIGIVNTGVGLKSIDIYQKARVPLMIAVSTGTSLTRKFAPPNAPENFIFRVSPTIEAETRTLAEELVRRNFVNVGLLADATPYGEAGKVDFERACAARGIRIVAVERFPIGTTDATRALSKLRAAQPQPQALAVWGIGPELAVIAKNRAAMNWAVPIVGSWTLSMANFIDGAGSAGEGARMPQTFIQEGGLSVRNGFLLAYARENKEDRIASPMSAAQGYDGMYLLINGIRQAGKTDGAAIKNALEDLRVRVQGVITIYERPFTPEDHEAITANMMVMGVVNRGRVTFAYAEDARRGMMIRRKDPQPSK